MKLNQKTVKNYLKEHRKDTAEVRYDDMCVTFRLTLTPDERSVFVRRVVENCFTEDGTCLPEYLDVLFRTTFLQMCSNVPVFVMQIKTKDGADAVDMETMDRLCRVLLGNEGFAGTDSFAKISGVLALYDEMHELCEKAMQTRQQELLARQNPLQKTADAVAELLETLADRITAADPDELADALRVLTDYSQKQAK